MIKENDFIYKVHGMYECGTMFLTSIIPSDMESANIADPVTHRGKIISKALTMTQEHKKTNRVMVLDVTKE